MRKRKERLRRESTTPRHINEDEITETTTGINVYYQWINWRNN